MHVVVYEYITAGGWTTDFPQQPPTGSLAAEGLAMVRALASDLTGASGISTTILSEAANPSLAQVLPPEVTQVRVEAGQEKRLLAELAAIADWVVVIAPESAGILFDRCQLVQQAGGRLLGPPLEMIELTSDKHRTCQRLAAAAIPVPVGRCLHPGDPWPSEISYPAVLKPNDGVGATDTFLLENRSTAQTLWEHLQPTAPFRVEQFLPGQTASILVASGPAEHLCFPPARQVISRQENRLIYQGGQIPAGPPDFTKRAQQLARQVAEALDRMHALWGIDFIFGTQSDGSEDAVVEINPRLTTSYVGLQTLACAAGINLSEIVLAIVDGTRPLHTMQGLSSRAVRFQPSGLTTLL